MSRRNPNGDFFMREDRDGKKIVGVRETEGRVRFHIGEKDFQHVLPLLPPTAYRVVVTHPHTYYWWWSPWEDRGIDAHDLLFRAVDMVRDSDPMAEQHGMDTNADYSRYEVLARLLAMGIDHIEGLLMFEELL